MTTYTQAFHEYRLIIQPDNEVYNKVLEEKQVFNAAFGEKLVDRSRPGITVATFQAKEEMEETIIRYLNRICCRQSGFLVELNNYSGKPSDSIYLRVQNPQSFNQIKNELQVVSNYISSCACPPVQVNKNPHIGIAQSLTESIFLQAMLGYGQKTFHEVFMVQEVLLVKKNHPYDQERSINIFRLKPVTKTQYN